MRRNYTNWMVRRGLEPAIGIQIHLSYHHLKHSEK